MIDLIDISEQSEGCGIEKKYHLADYFNRWWDEYANEVQNIPEAESDYENPFFCEYCQRMRVYVHTTIIRRIAPGKKPKTLIFKRFDAWKQKVA